MRAPELAARSAGFAFARRRRTTTTRRLGGPLQDLNVRETSQSELKSERIQRRIKANSIFLFQRPAKRDSQIHRSPRRASVQRITGRGLCVRGACDGGQHDSELRNLALPHIIRIDDVVIAARKAAPPRKFGGTQTSTRKRAGMQWRSRESIPDVGAHFPKRRPFLDRVDGTRLGATVEQAARSACCVVDVYVHSTSRAANATRDRLEGRTRRSPGRGEVMGIRRLHSPARIDSADKGPTPWSSLRRSRPSTRRP